MNQTADAEARHRIRTSLDESLIVEAAAGTGKTTALVDRIVGVIQSGRGRTQGIVAVTFTRKAAGELRLRLRHELDRRRAESTDPVERARLDHAVVHLEEAHVGTIHGFAAEILRERPVEAGIQPGFEELDEGSAARLFDTVFQRWFESRMEDVPAGLRRALARPHSFDRRTTSPNEIRNAAWNIVEWRDHPEPWGRKPFDRDSVIDRLAQTIGEIAPMAASGSPRDVLHGSLTPVIDVWARIERSEAVHARDYDDIEGLLVRLARDLPRNRRKGRGRYSPEVDREELIRRRNTLIETLEEFRIEADADLAAVLRDDLWELVDLYDAAKRETGKVDFADLLLAARNLVRDNRMVRNDLQARFTHIFVDEFQDTDPLQAEILSLLAADDPEVTDWKEARPAGGKLFLVGDPKQSIYRFRRADVVLYGDLARRLHDRNVGEARLSKSFRSVPMIQRLVNAAFEESMDGDRETGQPRYVPLEPVRAAVPGQPSVVALPIGSPYGRTTVTKSAINAELPRTVGAYLAWLIEESGWKVHDSSRALVPIAPSHIAVLFRRFVSWGTDITRDYVHALETRNIPHVLLGARSFHQREEVETLRAALEAIEWPDDELSVYATLKGALFAIPDSLLFRYAKEVGRLHPFRTGNDSNDLFAPVREALDVLARLHRKRNRQPFAETINAVLSSTRAHAGFALRPAGNQVLANVYQVGDLARTYEKSQGTSFRGFVERLREEAASTGGGEAPALEEGAEGVRLMTVHSAKGLEFGVVVLADITANLAAASPARHAREPLAAMRVAGCTPWDLHDHADEEHRRDRAEGVRIAYVAATRASDLLVVPSVGDASGRVGGGATDGWIGPIIRSLYPAEGSERRPRTARWCPPFGSDTVLDRPPERQSEAETAVAPGLHRTSDDVDVVWWDPSVLNLDVGANLGLREEAILSNRVDPDAAAESIAAYAAWSHSRERAIKNGRRRGLRVHVASDTDAEGADYGEGLSEVNIVVSPTAGERPAGRRFGSLVHLVLGDALAAARRGEEIALDGLATYHARVLGATGVESDAAREAAARAWDHPLIRRALGSDAFRVEYPLIVRIAEDEVLEGIADLAFLDAGTWHVVDFKTDLMAPSPERLGHYAAQVNRYRYLFERIMGLPTAGYVFGV